MGDVRENLRTDARAVLGKADLGSHLWSLAYNGGQLVALLCSIASTFILAARLDHVLGYHFDPMTVTAAFSAIAAAAIGLPKHADAERKWRANRHTRAEAKILDRYLAEFTFRHNRRAMGDGIRVNALLGQIEGRLTYKALIAHG